MPDPAKSQWWDPQLEVSGAGQVLPDCRVKYFERENALVRVGRMVLEKVYCASCSAEAPLASFPDSPHVFYLCDGCFNRMNRVAPAGTVEIPGT